jgi:uracil phosphoribosyltransferase
MILDPVIATGGTCVAAIQTLREWGAKKIIVMAVVGALEGIIRAAGEWPEATDIYIAGVDQELTNASMLKPGLGDVGDRLFLTVGK